MNREKNGQHIFGIFCKIKLSFLYSHVMNKKNKGFPQNIKD